MTKRELETFKRELEAFWIDAARTVRGDHSDAILRRTVPTRDEGCEDRPIRTSQHEAASLHCSHRPNPTPQIRHRIFRLRVSNQNPNFIRKSSSTEKKGLRAEGSIRNWKRSGLKDVAGETYCATIAGALVQNQFYHLHYSPLSRLEREKVHITPRCFALRQACPRPIRFHVPGGSFSQFTAYTVVFSSNSSHRGFQFSHRGFQFTQFDTFLGRTRWDPSRKRTDSVENARCRIPRVFLRKSSAWL